MGEKSSGGMRSECEGDAGSGVAVGRGGSGVGWGVTGRSLAVLSSWIWGASRGGGSGWGGWRAWGWGGGVWVMAMCGVGGVDSRVRHRDPEV